MVYSIYRRGTRNTHESHKQNTITEQQVPEVGKEPKMLYECKGLNWRQPSPQIEAVVKHFTMKHILICLYYLYTHNENKELSKICQQHQLLNEGHIHFCTRLILIHKLNIRWWNMQEWVTMCHSNLKTTITTTIELIIVFIMMF